MVASIILISFYSGFCLFTLFFKCPHPRLSHQHSQFFRNQEYKCWPLRPSDDHHRCPRSAHVYIAYLRAQLSQLSRRRLNTTRHWTNHQPAGIARGSDTCSVALDCLLNRWHLVIRGLQRTVSQIASLLPPSPPKSSQPQPFHHRPLHLPAQSASQTLHLTCRPQ